MPDRGWMRGVRPGVRVAEEGLGVSARPAPDLQNRTIRRIHFQWLLTPDSWLLTTDKKWSVWFFFHQPKTSSFFMVSLKELHFLTPELGSYWNKRSLTREVTAMNLSVLTAGILLSAIKLLNLDEILPNLSRIDLNVQLPPIVFSVLLTTGISAIILYLLPLAWVATQLFQGFWASLEQDY